MASKRHLLDMQLPYICECFTCGRKYKSKSGLWRHQIKHKPIIELLQTRIEKAPVENSELLQSRIEKAPVENSELLQTRIEKAPVEKSELLQTRIEKAPVEKSELLQTRIEKAPDKLVENTIVKTYCHDNDPSTEQKRKKEINPKNENKQKTKKKIRMQSHGRTKKRRKITMSSF
jgi:hypothetical protein